MRPPRTGRSSATIEPQGRWWRLRPTGNDAPSGCTTESWSESGGLVRNPIPRKIPCRKRAVAREADRQGPNPSMIPRVAVLAGPNGSGKTSFYRSHLRELFPKFVNADELKIEMAASSEGPPAPSDAHAGLAAAQRAEELRRELVRRREDFAFETVFSRTNHWLGFLRLLKDSGYEVILFFICTDHPLLNVARVGLRVEQGGHDVPAAKIVSRFSGSATGGPALAL